MKPSYSSIYSIFYGKLKHISRFSIVGIINTLIDFVMFTTAHGLLGITYTGSQIIGYSFGVLNSFILNKKWTFGDKTSNKKTLHELSQFVAVNLFSLIITLVTLNFLVKTVVLNVYLSKVLVTFIAQFTNFIGYKLWVFNARRK